MLCTDGVHALCQLCSSPATLPPILQALPPWLPAKRAAQLAAQHAERAAAAAAAGAVPTEASGA